jgi:hypothetical protein
MHHGAAGVPFNIRHSFLRLRNAFYLYTGDNSLVCMFKGTVAWEDDRVPVIIQSSLAFPLNYRFLYPTVPFACFRLGDFLSAVLMLFPQKVFHFLIGLSFTQVVNAFSSEEIPSPARIMLFLT